MIEFERYVCRLRELAVDRVLAVAGEQPHALALDAVGLDPCRYAAGGHAGRQILRIAKVHPVVASIKIERAASLADGIILGPADFRVQARPTTSMAPTSALSQIPSIVSNNMP